MKKIEEELSHLPGADIVLQGLQDLAQKRSSQSALLVLIAGPSLRRLGLEIPDPPDIPRPREHLLFTFIESTSAAGAHSRYNSLLRRMASFSRALAHVRRS